VKASLSFAAGSLFVFTGVAMAACSSEPAWGTTCGGISDGRLVDTLKYAITVVDARGAPAPNLVIYDTIPRTNDGFIVPQPDTSDVPGRFPVGRYRILRLNDDVMRLDHRRDIVRVRGVGGGRQFSASYTFGETGPCTYGKISGPDTVVAQ
jgi:hypothetical protein